MIFFPAFRCPAAKEKKWGDRGVEREVQRKPRNKQLRSPATMQKAWRNLTMERWLRSKPRKLRSKPRKLRRNPCNKRLRFRTSRKPQSGLQEIFLRSETLTTWTRFRRNPNHPNLPLRNAEKKKKMRASA